MPVHIEEMTSEVTVATGDLPLTPAQIDTLVEIVLSRMAVKKRSARWTREATTIRRGSTSQLKIDE